MNFALAILTLGVWVLMSQKMPTWNWFNNENDEQDFFQFDDLTLTDEQLSEIKGGPDGWGCSTCGYSNHNETTVKDDADEIDLDDLSLTDEQLAEIKGGACPSCNWGPPILNHNETAVEDDEAETDTGNLANFTGPVIMFAGGHGFGSGMIDTAQIMTNAQVTLNYNEVYGHVDHVFSTNHLNEVEKPISQWLKEVFKQP